MTESVVIGLEVRVWDSFRHSGDFFISCLEQRMAGVLQREINELGNIQVNGEDRRGEESLKFGAKHE